LRDNKENKSCKGPFKDLRTRKKKKKKWRRRATADYLEMKPIGRGRQGEKKKIGEKKKKKT
jgi:hypothetical protein